MKTFNTIYRENKLRESITGATMEICSLLSKNGIKNIDPKMIMDCINNSPTEKEIKETAIELSRDNYSVANDIFDIIKDITINERERIDRELAMV